MGKSSDKVQGELAECLDRARARWPDVHLGEAEFLGAAMARLGANPSPEDLKAFHGEEFFLACACAKGNATAIALCEEEYFEDAVHAVRALDSSSTFVDEVLQRLRQHLFMHRAPGGLPRIAMFSARGSLAGWIRMTAVRTGLNLRRQHGGEVTVDVSHLEDIPVDDAELAFAKKQHRAKFKAAFQAAFEELSKRDRTVLRLNVLDGLNIDEIGTVYRVHRTTVARWMGAARETLLAATKRRLQAELRVTTGEVDGLYRFIQSQLDLSLARLLKGA